MKRLILITALLYWLAMPALAQVDTLSFSLVNQISVADAWPIHTSDIQGDGIKELIVQTNNNIYIYDSANNNLIWTSPPLRSYNSYPWSFGFFDLNRDGDLDIAILDTLLGIFDIVHDQLLWASPALPSSQSSCSTISDLDSDSSYDIIIVHRESHLGDGAFDTTWVDIFNGPEFNPGPRFFFLVGGWDRGSQTLIETPSSAKIIDLSGQNGLEKKLIIFLQTTTWEFTWLGEHNEWYVLNRTLSGRIAIINPVDFEINMINNTGAMEYYSVKQIDSATTSLNVITDTYQSSQGNIFPVYFHDSKRLMQLSADGLLDSTLIWYSDSFPKSYVVGEIDPNNPGDELFYSLSDTARLLSFPELNTIWIQAIGTTFMNGVYIYNSNSLFSHPQIFSHTPLKLIDGHTGQISAAFIQGGISVVSVDELNNDGEDEFLQGALGPVINIYRAIRYSVNVEYDSDKIPSHFALHPAYPNPFNATTIIKYDLPKSADVKIEIFDILGRRVATLADGREEAGSHQVVWNGSSVSSGIYFYCLKATDFSEIKKMTLLK